LVALDVWWVTRRARVAVLGLPLRPERRPEVAR
jgi:hypothetical protein